jgi:transcriptional regulator with XRE-family HTH domain
MHTRNVTTQESRSFRTLLLAVAIDSDEIGRRIKRAREGRGWTQLVFASEASVSPSTVQRWESGRLPPVRELIRIAGVEVERMRELNDRMVARLADEEAPRRGRRPA